MSNRILTYPRTRRESEWQLSRRHHSSRRGVMSDYARGDIPPDGVWESDNVILRGSPFGEVRSGTMLINTSHADLPAVSGGTGISASKSGSMIIISAGYALSSINVGDYFQWGSGGDNELITSVDAQNNLCIVSSSRTHVNTTTGRIRQEVNADIWDKVNKKHVILLGTKVYYADWNVSSWTEAYCISGTAPANTKSIMRQYGKNIYLWNSNGKYIIEMGATIPTISKLNNTMLECPIDDIAETSSLVYGRRYTATMIEMLGSYHTDSYNGNTVNHESSPWAIDSDGKDYAERFYSTLPEDSGRQLPYLQIPYTESGGTYTYNQEYTHYRFYGTKDVGPNGIDTKTGKGNNPELFIHLEDVPVLSSFVVSTSAGGTITASKGTFHDYDVGSDFWVDSTHDGTITAVNSSTEAVWNKAWEYTDVAGAIGCTSPFIFSQSGTAITAESGTPFDWDSIGKRIFASDGTLILIVGYTDSTHVTAADSTTRTSLGGAIIESPTSSAIVNRRHYNDTVSDDVLSTRINKVWCKNRFWEPLPNCNVGVELDGFFASAVRGESAIYFTQLANDYYSGYYDPEFQIDTVQDAIQSLRVYPSILSAICSQSTISWNTEVTGSDTRPGLALYSSFLAQKKPVDYKTGTMFPESIVSVDEGLDILFTNNSEVRLFDGKNYGPNIAEGKIMKSLRQLQHIGAASYDTIGGYILWGTEGALTSISSVNRLPFPDACWRFAIREEQGVIGGIKYSGDDWLQPPNGICGKEILDSGNRPMQVVLDNLIGMYYWVSTYNGPTGSGLTKTFVDKDDGTGDGTEISWSLTPGADVGNIRKHDIRHEVSNLTIDPDDPSNADASGYDSDGFRDGLEIDLTMYNSSDWDTAVSTAENVTKDGDISFDESITIQDKAIQIKISGNRSECIISEIINYYTVMDHAAAPSKREMTEGDYQSNLKAPVLWLSRGSNLYKNLITGTSISGTATGATGPDGKSNSAFQISSALSTINVTLTSGGLMFWANGTVTVTIGGNSVQLGTVGTHGGFTLYYADSVTESGTFVLTPSGTRIIEDLRVYSTSIVDSDTRSYLYNDMVRNNGNNTMRIW